jgi:hypothetical protein
MSEPPVAVGTSSVGSVAVACSSMSMRRPCAAGL